MENREFIESGYLESYVLGLATEVEKELVSKKLLEDQNISTYLVDLETDIRKYFDGTSVLPPSEVREIIHLRNLKTDIKKEKHVFNNASRNDGKKNNEYLDIEVNDTYIKVHKYWRPAFIAVFVLSKVFLIAGLYYYFKTTSLEQEILRLKTTIQQVK